jgi:HEPN domain-containing protein
MSYSGHIAHAERELERGRVLAEHDDIDGAVQHACLAVEHALKAVLASEDERVPTGSKGHDLNFLASQSSMNIPFEMLLITLDGAYNRTRYPDTPPHGITDPESVLNDVESLIAYVTENTNQ